MSVIPTRVLMTTDTQSGVWTYTLDLARGLRKRSIDVVLAAMGPAPTAAERGAAEELGVRLEHAPLRLEWMSDPWHDLETAGDWLLDLERRHGCDLVHLNGYALASRELASPKIVVAHSCVLSWWEAVLGEPAPPEWGRYTRAVSEGLAAASHVVAPTRWMHDALERHYGQLARASVIDGARRPGVFEPGRKVPFVLGAGRVWDEATNLHTLARAGRSISWPVKIAGPIVAPRDDGQEAEPKPAPKPETEPDARAEAGDEFEGVELLGALSAADMAELYAAAAIFAAPSRYEPGGFSVLEAALSGCALVLGDIPSLRELWEDAAVFVPSDDVAALSACLHDLVRHPELAHEMGVEAQARAASAHRYEDMVDAYARLYATAGEAAPDEPELAATADQTA